MISFIEALYKSDAKIQFGWNAEPVTVQSYKVYVGQAPGTLVLLAANINPQTSNDPSNYHKVIYTAQIADVRTLLSLPASLDFSNLLLYWAITYVNNLGVESLLADSRVVEVPPVGILGKVQKEDPTANRHMYGFSDGLQRWIKTAATTSGAIIVSSDSFYQSNVTTEYTYDSSGRILTELSYPSDRTTSGSPAKLITNTYGSSGLIKKVVTDSTV